MQNACDTHTTSDANFDELEEHEELVKFTQKQFRVGPSKRPMNYNIATMALPFLATVLRRT